MFMHIKCAKIIDTYHNIARRYWVPLTMQHVFISLKYRLLYPRDQKSKRFAGHEWNNYVYILQFAKDLLCNLCVVSGFRYLQKVLCLTPLLSNSETCAYNVIIRCRICQRPLRPQFYSLISVKCSESTASQSKKFKRDLRRHLSLESRVINHRVIDDVCNKIKWTSSKESQSPIKSSVGILNEFHFSFEWFWFC